VRSLLADRSAVVCHRHPLRVNSPTRIRCPGAPDRLFFRHFWLAEVHIRYTHTEEGEEIPRDAHFGRFVRHVEVDKGAIVHDLALG